MKNNEEWYQEIIRLGHLVEAWGGDAATEIPPEEILNSMQRLGIIVPIDKPSAQNHALAGSL